MREEMTHSFCGSAEYMAPEMLLKYTILDLGRVIASRLTTTVWEPYSTSF
jgi:serine/threonine protein kinase